MMLNRPYSRSFAVGSLLILLLVAVGSSACSGDISPTAPTLEQPTQVVSAVFGVSSTSVISGQLLSGGGSAAAYGGMGGDSSSLTATPATVSNLQISVTGTNIWTTTDAFGNFRLVLVDTPSGNVMLRISGSSVDADVSVHVTGANKNLKVKIKVDGSSAQVMTTEIEDLGQFDGDLAAVDLTARSFTLEDGTTILDADLTWWEMTSELASLEEMAQALDEGKQVEVEGRTVLTDGGLLIATIIRAEIDDDGDEFKGIVVSVDRFAETVTLFDGTVVAVDFTTLWDPEGDFLSFATLADAVEALGIFVEVEGEGSLQTDGSLLAAKIEAEDSEFALEFEPDEWDIDWAGSATGTVEARLEDGPFDLILASSIEMQGPDGTIFPIATSLGDKKLIADFSKSQAFGIVSSLAVDTTVDITVRGTLTDGTPWELSAAIEVVDEDDLEVDPEVIAEAIEDVEDLIEDIRELIDDGEISAGNGNSLISKLLNVIAKLQKGNVRPAINQLNAFINEVEAFVKTGKISSDDGNDLIEAAQEIRDDLLS